MSTYGMFSSSILGMTSQSHALESIAGNIANLRTGGYKRTDVEFATVLSRTVSSQPGAGDAPAGTNHADFGGTRPIDRQRVSLQGLVQATDRPLDVAINGRGLFVLNTEPGGGGETLYGRDGRFTVTAVPDGGGDGHVIDKNGYYVQGYVAGPGGTATAGGAFETLRLPPDLSIPGSPTTTASLGLNLPAATDAGEVRTHVIDVFDSAGRSRNLSLDFTRAATPNLWDFNLTTGGGDVVTVGPSTQPSLVTGPGQTTVFDAVAGTITIQDAVTGVPVAGAFAPFAVGDTLTVADTTLVNGNYVIGVIAADGSSVTLGPSTPLAADETVATLVTFSGPPAVPPLRFRPDGFIDSPDAYAINVAHADGATSAFTLDIAAMTQFGGPLLPVTWNRDGFPPGQLVSLSFDTRGHLIGSFDNAQNVPLYRLAIADFINPDGLQARSGNVYAVSESSGRPNYGAAGEAQFGALMPSAHELSNVDLAQEFTRMTMTQSVYNASATSFKTLDEMTQTARDLG